MDKQTAMEIIKWGLIILGPISAYLYAVYTNMDNVLNSLKRIPAEALREHPLALSAAALWYILICFTGCWYLIYAKWSMQKRIGNIKIDIIQRDIGDALDKALDESDGD